MVRRGQWGFRRSIIAGAALCIVCAGLVGCAAPLASDANLVGTWVADTEAGAQTLVLSRNHTYLQVIDRDSEIKTAQGTWSAVDGTTQGVLLHGAQLFNGQARTVPAWHTGDWSLRLKERWGTLHLYYDDALPSGFTKSANPDRRWPG